MYLIEKLADLVKKIERYYTEELPTEENAWTPEGDIIKDTAIENCINFDSGVTQATWDIANHVLQAVQQQVKSDRLFDIQDTEEFKRLKQEERKVEEYERMQEVA